MYLNADAILDADDKEFVEVPVPEWGGTVRLASITGATRDEFEQTLVKMRGNNREQNLTNVRARLISKCAVDASGARMFRTDDQVRALGKKNARVLERLFDACRKLAGMTEEDVESLVKDFEETPDED